MKVLSRKRIKNNFSSICKLFSQMKTDDFICVEKTIERADILFMKNQIRQIEKQIFEIIEQSEELLENFNLVTGEK